VTGHCGGVGSLRNKGRRQKVQSSEKKVIVIHLDWTGLHLIREPLGMSGLKEGSAGAVGG
jgi:hypothetical protein